MARSRRKTPICGFVQTRNGSQKAFRSYEHGRRRVAERSAIQNIRADDWDDDIEMPNYKTYGDEWVSPRDGRCRLHKWAQSNHVNATGKYAYCRHCIYTKLMRK